MTRQVKRGEREVRLPNKEFALLEYMVRHPGIVVTRRMIEEHVWNLGLDADSNVIEVHINRLRAKLCEGKEEDIIETIRGTGYRLRTP